MDYAMEAGHTPTSNGHSAHRHNVGKADRVISAMLGAQTLLRMGKWHGWGKAAAATSGIMLITRAATGHSRVYEALGVSSAGLEQGAGINLDASITIMRPRDEIFEFWRDVTNLPLVMRHLESVDERGDGVTHWVAHAPHGMTVEWDAQLINEQYGELLAWQSLPESEIEHAGSIHFRDAGDKGTEVLLRMRYQPSKWRATAFGVAKFLAPGAQAEVASGLRRLKHVMETGIDITAEGQPSGQEER
ncbi:DUF2892 domain-containing protein [bacterium]|nr:DUF2892 domain-containing protein [bacterium]